MKNYIGFVVLICCACNTNEESNERKIDSLVNKTIQSDHAGLTIAVAKEDRMLFSKGYGLANHEYDIPNTPSTIFHVASVSKQFTAFAIALLADQGKLSLDDDIRNYLPEIPDFGYKITIKQLAHHTSGLRDQWNLLALAGWRLDDVITRDQVIRLMSHQKELNFRPGEEFSYCNTGYTLMAEIVSRVTGKPFPKWCRENIFQPLGMENTLFYDDHEMIVKNRAYSYYESGNDLKKSVLNYANAGATSLFTTAEDLTKWSNNFYRMKVGNAGIMNQMEERAVLNKGDTIDYALGQGISTYKGIRMISHDGADAGYRSILMRFPDQEVSIAVLGNLGSFNPGQLAFKLADIYLRDDLKEPEKKSDEKVVTPTVAVSDNILKKYEGQFQLTPQMIVTFKIQDGKFVAQPGGQRVFALVARAENEFVIDGIDATVIFNKDSDGSVNTFTLHQNGTTTVARRVKPFDPKTIRDINEYAGSYFSRELQTTYILKVTNDTLVATHIRHDPSKLIPIAKEAFSTDVWFMSRIDFVRNSRFEIIGMRVSSGRVRNVMFEKQ